MELGRLVEVYSFLNDDDNGERGTGYLLNSCCIITAYHNISKYYENGNCEIKIYDEKKSNDWIEADCVWKSDYENHDIALLVPKNQDQFGDSKQSVKFGRLEGKDSIEIKGIGFPDARAEGSLTEKMVIEGKCNPMNLDSRGKITFKNDGIVPSKSVNWKGASGTALFTEDLLICVVTEVPKNFGADTLKATTIFKLMEDSNFVDKCKEYGVETELVRISRNTVMDNANSSVPKVGINNLESQLKTRILYLYANPIEVGVDYITNRNLVDELKKEYQLTQKFAIWDDSKIIEKPFLVKQAIGYSKFMTEFDILIIERTMGIFFDVERVNSQILKNYLKRGGIILFLFSEDVSERDFYNYNEFLKQSGLPELRAPRKTNDFPHFSDALESVPQGLIVGNDLKNAIPKGSESGYCYNININDNYLQNIDIIARPIFEDVKNIAVNSSVQVQASKNFLFGNFDSTRMLCRDMYWDGDMSHVLGGYNDCHSKGIGILLTGGICSDDVIGKYSSDSIKLVMNLLNHIMKLKQERELIDGK